VLLRPIEADDKQLLAVAFARMSESSRYRRFFALSPALTPPVLAFLTEVDQREHVAIIAIEPDTGDALGVARFVRLQDDRHAAEAAVAVIDEWHGRGLGTALLTELTGRAREEGLTHFTAIVKAENAGALRLFTTLGESESSHQAGEVTLRIAIGDERERIGVDLARALRQAGEGSLQFVSELANRFPGWFRQRPSGQDKGDSDYGGPNGTVDESTEK
jgi:ribosomal protein S18 acetylase RimI-like enzyme